MTKVYISGKFYEKQDAKVSVFDHGLLYGDGLFETLAVRQGKLFRVERHLRRLAKIHDFEARFSGRL